VKVGRVVAMLKGGLTGSCVKTGDEVCSLIVKKYGIEI
jgi:hypothetical protein